jgi:hypothetical protein
VFGALALPGPGARRPVWAMREAGAGGLCEHRRVYPMDSGAIAVLLVVAIGVVFWRLAARGPSRMSRALYTVGAVALCLWLLGIVLSFLGRPGPG